MKHVGGGGEIRAQSRAEPVFPSSGFPHSDSESLRAGGPRRRVARHHPQAQGTAVSVCHILALCSETAVAINKQCWKATGSLPGSFQDSTVSRPTFGQLPSLRLNRISPFLETTELEKKCSLACPESSKMSTMTIWLQSTLFFHMLVPWIHVLLNASDKTTFLLEKFTGTFLMKWESWRLLALQDNSFMSSWSEWLTLLKTSPPHSPAASSFQNHNLLFSTWSDFHKVQCKH